MATLVIIEDSIYQSIGRLEDPSRHEGKMLLHVYPTSGDSPVDIILAHKVVRSSVTGDILCESDKGNVYTIPKGAIIFAYISWDVSKICIGDILEEDGRYGKVVEKLELSKYVALAMCDGYTPPMTTYRVIIKEQTK